MVTDYIYNVHTISTLPNNSVEHCRNQKEPNYKCLDRSTIVVRI